MRERGYSGEKQRLDGERAVLPRTEAADRRRAVGVRFRSRSWTHVIAPWVK